MSFLHPSRPSLRGAALIAAAVAVANFTDTVPSVAAFTPVPAGAIGAPEARVLWVSRFDYDSAQRIEHVIRTAAGAGFNVIYFQVRGAADAFYRSDIEPCAVRLCGRLGGTPTYDPLEIAVREAKRSGVQLHAWLNALPGAPAGIEAACRLITPSALGNPTHVLLTNPEWAMSDRTGKRLACPNGEEYIWLSPAYDEVRTQLARVAADVARRYDVDGIHLDRIRYPGQAWSYDAASLSAFGLDPASRRREWNLFRRELVNAMVRETFDSMTSVKPRLVLSAAVWAVYEDRWGWRTQQGMGDLFQDPRAWTEGGYLDVAVPMTYYRIGTSYCGRVDWACLLDDHLSGVQRAAAGRHVYAGIDASKGADEVVKQIRMARRKGAKGVSVFSFTSADRAGLWPVLSSSVFAQRAEVPAMPWKHATASASRHNAR